MSYPSHYNTGSITATAGSVCHTTTEKIRGAIHSIKVDYQDTTSTGSLWIVTNSEKDPEETILSLIPFTADRMVYPRAIVHSTTGSVAAAGDNLYEKFVVNSPLKVWVEGGGAGKYVKNVTITYI